MSPLDLHGVRVMDTGKCPCCGSESIEGGFIEIRDEEAWQEVRCGACGACWDEVYAFQRRENVVAGNQGG